MQGSGASPLPASAGRSHAEKSLHLKSMCEILEDPNKCDRRKNRLCVECGKKRCAQPEDEICRPCWDASIADANNERIKREMAATGRPATLSRKP
jgi:hypothetical protein